MLITQEEGASTMYGFRGAHTYATQLLEAFSFFQIVFVGMLCKFRIKGRKSSDMIYPKLSFFFLFFFLLSEKKKKKPAVLTGCADFLYPLYVIAKIQKYSTYSMCTVQNIAVVCSSCINL